MRNPVLLCIALMLAFPALAAEPVRKALPQQELTRQETVALGSNRFLIFSGTSNGRGEYGYSVDLVKIDDGVPHFDPLFIEEYVRETNSANLSYGVAFMALSYRFDKADNTMTYTFSDEDTQTRYQLKYWLDVDIFKLREVISQTMCPKEPCPPSLPKTVFKAP